VAALKNVLEGVVFREGSPHFHINTMDPEIANVFTIKNLMILTYISLH